MADAPITRDMTSFLRPEAVRHAFRRLEGQVVLDTPETLKARATILLALATTLAIAAWTVPVPRTEVVTGTIVYPGSETTLRATGEGVVVDVLAGVGTSVDPDDPIVRIAYPASRPASAGLTVKTLTAPRGGRIAFVAPVGGRLDRRGAIAVRLVPAASMPTASFPRAINGAKLPVGQTAELRWATRSGSTASARITLPAGSSATIDHAQVNAARPAGPLVVALPVHEGRDAMPAVGTPVTGRFVRWNTTIGAMLTSSSDRGGAA